MIDPIDDIVRQARQGSVSAIIQVLNERLAGSGIRTRAMFAQGVLQLLCEAAKPEQLEQPIVVPQVQQILESLQPRSIRRVNVNSRIVREQQLLWLEEISRDPKQQLLWSEEIVLRQPTLFKRLRQDWRDHSPDPMGADLPKKHPHRLEREKRVFWRGLMGGASFSIVLLALGWMLQQRLNPITGQEVSSEQTGASSPSANSPPANLALNNSPSVESAQSAIAPPSPSALSPVALKQDPFADAVRLAQETVTAGQKAQSSAEWLNVAAQWQKASDLMGMTSAEDSRYAVAQDRVQVYQQNSESALQQAQSQR
ncbi:MAG: hypothetical protein KME15_19485 [Drouetiella hepatica Uher 2000/2452]|jgi:hypothetical protein|uniref:Uncharacterized protein n=1 Tax=Drouetiella hepatica Uher 2000/2452 TaxID=904376 RepID=A0A951UNV9_9CYAN|nr:hypothetical protein [Drouetiella hepatica Uher 2000/2452]